jgi:Tfp pilus assembly protein PilF
MDLRNHERMREDMEMLVRTYQHQGQLQDANVTIEVPEIQKQILGNTHPRTLRSMEMLALIYQGQGQLKRAENVIEEAIRLQADVLGEMDPQSH